MPESVVRAEIAGARPGLIGPHLRAVENRGVTAVKIGGLMRLRRDVLETLSSAELTDSLQNHGYALLADRLR